MPPRKSGSARPSMMMTTTITSTKSRIPARIPAIPRSRGEEAAEVGTGSARSPVDESAAEELRKKRQALRRRYKIQDVIQRRQVCWCRSSRKSAATRVRRLPPI